MCRSINTKIEAADEDMEYLYMIALKNALGWASVRWRYKMTIKYCYARKFLCNEKELWKLFR